MNDINQDITRMIVEMRGLESCPHRAKVEATITC